MVCYVFRWKAPCVAFEIFAFVSCLALCAFRFSCNSNDVWCSLRGVPRTFGLTLVLPDSLSGFTSRGRGVSDCIWAVALVSRLVSRAFVAFFPHKPGPMCPLSNPHARPVEGGGLNSSPELAAYTPASPNPSSTEELVLAPRLASLPPGPHPFSKRALFKKR